MIRLENINISFDRVLLENAKISLKKGKITVIKGESGSGKSSLLYLIGLLNIDKDLVYYFHDRLINTTNDALIASLRKTKIGYVFQDNSLIEHLTVLENMELYSRMISKKLEKEEIYTLLERVSLSKNINQSVTTLSGGEKQRLAIACAMIKNPELLILDEPTSALDEINANGIMNILKQLAQSGMTILLSSHDLDIIEKCDIIYEFKNRKLVCNEAFIDDQESLNLKIKKLTLPFYLDYFKKYFISQWKSYCLLFILLSFIISLIAGYRNIGDAFEQKQLVLLDNIANCEILVTSSSDEYGDAVYSDMDEPISKTKINNLRNSQYCLNVYSFYQGYTDKILINGLEVNYGYVIQPYTKERNISSDLSFKLNSDNGIFLSYEAAKSLNVVEGEEFVISFSFSLPDGSIEDISYLVSGVLKEDAINYYTTSQSILYVPYELMPIYEHATALLVYANHFNEINPLLEKINDIDPNFGTFNVVSRVNYLQETMDAINSTTPFLLVIFLGVTISVIAIIYSRQIGNRKYELCLLRVNGMSKFEITKMILIELIIQICVISLLSFIWMIVIKNLIYFYFDIAVIVNIVSFNLKSFFFITLFICPSSFLSILIYQKKSISQMIRN